MPQSSARSRKSNLSARSTTNETRGPKKRTSQRDTQVIERPHTGIAPDFQLWPFPSFPHGSKALVPSHVERLVRIRSSTEDSTTVKKKPFSLPYNRVVYDSITPNTNKHTTSDSIKSANEKNNKSGYSPWYRLVDDKDKTLVFESRFESGNLRRTVQKFENEYDLYIQPDIRTNKHVQWFYFAVSNTTKNQTYRFNIINIEKNSSCFNLGMVPCFLSLLQAYRTKEIKWHRFGSSPSHTSLSDFSTIPAFGPELAPRKDGPSFNCISFDIKFPHDDDTCLIAHCFPYTYTQLQTYLFTLASSRQPQMISCVRRRQLCTTTAGNKCDMLVITDWSSKKSIINKRKGIVVTARVHPSESCASYVVEGLLDFLLSSAPEAQRLRKLFVVRVVPMLNPDGVIVGNNRCSLAAVDLNRQWAQPTKELHPTLYHSKKMIAQFCQEREVLFYMDIHGHSRRLNSFLYGIKPETVPDNFKDVIIESLNEHSPAIRNKKKRLASTMEQVRQAFVRLYPRLLSQYGLYFSFADCRFDSVKGKEGTARVVMSKTMRIPHSFTLEASFGGCDHGSLQDCHFNISHYKHMGVLVAHALLDLHNPDQAKVRSMLAEVMRNPTETFSPRDKRKKRGNSGSSGALFPLEPSEGIQPITLTSTRPKPTRPISSSKRTSSSTTTAGTTSKATSNSNSSGIKNTNSNKIASISTNNSSSKVPSSTSPSNSRNRKRGISDNNNNNNKVGRNIKDGTSYQQTAQQRGKLLQNSCSTRVIPNKSNDAIISHGDKIITASINRRPASSDDACTCSSVSGNAGLTSSSSSHTKTASNRFYPPLQRPVKSANAGGQSQETSSVSQSSSMNHNRSKVSLTVREIPQNNNNQNNNGCSGTSQMPSVINGSNLSSSSSVGAPHRSLKKSRQPSQLQIGSPILGPSSSIRSFPQVRASSPPHSRVRTCTFPSNSPANTTTPVTNTSPTRPLFRSNTGIPPKDPRWASRPKLSSLISSEKKSYNHRQIMASDSHGRKRHGFVNIHQPLKNNIPPSSTSTNHSHSNNNSINNNMHSAMNSSSGSEGDISDIRIMGRPPIGPSALVL